MVCWCVAGLGGAAYPTDRPTSKGRPIDELGDLGVVWQLQLCQRASAHAGSAAAGEVYPPSVCTAHKCRLEIEINDVAPRKCRR